MSELVWQTLFETVDRNGDGQVDRDELQRVLHRLGHRFARASVDDVLDSYDADASGTLSFSQFLKLVQGQKPPVNPEVVRAFRSMDLNNDGELTVDELDQVFTAAGIQAREDIEQFIKESDVDHDGRLTFQDFLAIAAHTH